MLDAVSGASSYSGEIFIDVRTDEEWAQGHKPGALHFDLETIELGMLPQLPKTTRIALYCRSGGRAGRALEILTKNGFTRARNAGGLADVMEKGHH